MVKRKVSVFRNFLSKIFWERSLLIGENLTVSFSAQMITTIRKMIFLNCKTFWHFPFEEATSSYQLLNKVLH